MKIMIFLHGTTVMHRNALGHTREERVRQVLEGDASIFDFAAYVPVGGAVQKLQAWKEQGAEIAYLSSNTEVEELEKDTRVLAVHGFPVGPLLFRQGYETYRDEAERILPDILIEDDCESIGGEVQMTYTHIRQELKSRIRHIVVREFDGIDHLPDPISLI